MLEQATSPQPSNEILTSFYDAVTALVGIIETKISINPRRDAEDIILKLIDVEKEQLSQLGAEQALRLVRCCKCIRAARGLGFSADEFKSFAGQAIRTGGIEAFADGALRNSLEDVLLAQPKTFRGNLIQDWVFAVFSFAKYQGQGESLLTLFGGWMRGFDHEVKKDRNLLTEFFLGDPIPRGKLDTLQSVQDFANSWDKIADARVIAAPHERAELYRTLRSLLRVEDDPGLSRIICRSLVSPLSKNCDGLLTLLGMSRSSEDTRALLFSWAVIFEREQRTLRAKNLSMSDKSTIVEFDKERERINENIRERVGKALRSALPIPEGDNAKLSATERIILSLVGIGLSSDSKWAKLSNSKFFKEIYQKAPDKLVEFVEAISNRSPDELTDLLPRIDEASYFDVFNENSIPLIIALLPELDRRGVDLHPVLAVARSYEAEHSPRQHDIERPLSFDLGVYSIEYGPPKVVKVKNEFIFAWKFDPRFADKVKKICNDCYSPPTPESGEIRAKVTHNDIYHYVSRYLAEHRNFYVAYRILGNHKISPNFMWDDSPFLDPEERSQAREETLSLMRRSYDLSLRFFTFFDVESKRAPGHQASLVERFLKSSFNECRALPDTKSQAFPGNGWFAQGLKLGEFGLTPARLAEIFGSQSEVINSLSQMKILVTQGLVAIWFDGDRAVRIDDKPQAWVFFNRHFMPSGQYVSDLVDVAHIEYLVDDLLNHGAVFRDAKQFGELLGSERKNIAWIGNITGSLSNAYSYNSGPFEGEAYFSGREVREPGGHVHKHYLLGPASNSVEVLKDFKRAHANVYSAFLELELALTAGFLYTYSLYKKGFSKGSLLPTERAKFSALNISNLPGINMNHLLMLSYAEDVYAAVKKGAIAPHKASILALEDPLMLRGESQRLAIDCGDLTIRTWKNGKWLEIDDLKEHSYPKRAEVFWRYFGVFINDNSTDLRSLNRNWINL
mgnify:CR=1 FL=1